MIIPFATNSYRHDSLPISAQRALNLYAERQPQDAKTQVSVHGSPGIVTWATAGAGPVRGFHMLDGLLYVVSGPWLYSVTNDPTPVVTRLGGQISGSGVVSMADNDTEIMITNGSNGYVYDTSAGFRIVTDTDFHAANTTTYLDGFFLFDRVNTPQFFRSDLLAGTSYDALAFATKESKSDHVQAVINVRQTLYVLGVTSSEIWRNMGVANFPFQRLGALDRGIIAPHANAQEDQALFIVADDRMAYRVGEAQLTRVSTHAIEQTWQKYTSVSNAFGLAYSFNGHKFIVFTFPTEQADLGDTTSWAYDISTGLWHEKLSYDLNGTPLGRWRGNCAIEAYGKVLIGDSVTGKIGYLDGAVNTEFGDPMYAQASGPVLHASRKRAFMSLFELDMETGTFTPPAITRGVEASLITSGTYLGHFKYLGAQSGINNYFVFSGMALSDQFTSDEILDAAAVALQFCVVPRRANSSAYSTYGQLSVFTSGKIFFANLTGTSAGSEPSDAAITTGGQFLVDGSITWEYTGVQVPTTWSEFITDIGPSLSPAFVSIAGIETPDSNDAYTGVFLAAVAKAIPTSTWLAAASGIPGYTRIELLAKLALENITNELNGTSGLPNTFQAATNAAGSAYDFQFLADATEAWSGLVALAELQTTAGNTSAATAATTAAATLRTNILALYDSSVSRFRTYYGQTTHGTLTGNAAFVSDFRFHLWPAIHDLLTDSELETYRDGVITYTTENTPDLYDALTDDFVLSEWYWGVARSDNAAADTARTELLARFNARAENRRTLTDVALAGDFFEVPNPDPQVMLDIADDGGPFGPLQTWQSLGRKGNRGVRLRWKKLGKFYSRVMRITISDAVKRSIIAANAEIKVGMG